MVVGTAVCTYSPQRSTIDARTWIDAYTIGSFEGTGYVRTPICRDCGGAAALGSIFVLIYPLPLFPCRLSCYASETQRLFFLNTMGREWRQGKTLLSPSLRLVDYGYVHFSAKCSIHPSIDGSTIAVNNSLR